MLTSNVIFTKVTQPEPQRLSYLTWVTAVHTLLCKYHHLSRKRKKWRLRCELVSWRLATTHQPSATGRHYGNSHHSKSWMFLKRFTHYKPSYIHFSAHSVWVKLNVNRKCFLWFNFLKMSHLWKRGYLNLPYSIVT